MNCTSCQRENPADAAFCAGCGQKLARTCPSCDRPNDADASFCNGCGSSLAAPEPPLRSQAAERSPADYTPKHLADKILQSKSALEGERKHVTVMFADVKGSMELAGQLDPEVWHRILERFFEILTEGVHRFEGTVNQYTGDGIMALFGAPIAHEDHAQRACYAALHIQAEMVRYARELKREHGLGFSTRTGLHSGEVVVGKIGDDLRMDYTAQGHSVGLAQRMESLAEPNACYLTAATGTLVGGYFALEDLGEFPVKGMPDPVGVCRLVGVGDARNRFDISRSRGLSRFVGRASDMRTLDDATEQTAAGNGQVVGVVAMAGTGKSRLCFEFLERCRARGMQVFEGRAVAHGKNIPFLPILEIYRAFFGITLQDDDRSAREKIAGRMVLLDVGFADALPLLFDFLGVADSQQAALRLDPDARQRQLLSILRNVTQSVSEEQPTVTMIEDLHWLDDASGEFLAEMVDAREGTRNLLLLNFRPEFHADWMQKSWYRQIPLTPLGRDAIAELLEDLLGNDPSIAELATPIHARTAGNPFFTEEVAQTLIESGHLEGTRGAYRLVTSIDKLGVPPTVQAVLAARIDRLPEREKQLLQVASVIGKDFPEPLLAEVAELPVDDLKASLAALRQAEFIHEQGIYPVVEYSFKHPLTQEVALGTQLKERRRALHTAVADAIERQDPDHLDERAALLAHHFEEAGNASAAVRWHHRAAEWVGLTDFAAAAYHWGRVRELVRDLPDDPELVRVGIAACIQLLTMMRRLGGEPEEATALLEEGQALANAIGDAHAHLNVSLARSRIFASFGEIAAYVELATANDRAAQEIDDIAVQADAAFYFTDAIAFAGRMQEALAKAEDGLARFPRDSPAESWTSGVNPYWVLSVWRGACLGWMGRLPEAFDALERARRIGEEDNTPEACGFTHIRLAEAAYLAGDAKRALANARQLEEVSRRLGEPGNMAAVAHLSLAWGQLAAGRPADAIEPARSALALLGDVERVFAGEAATSLATALLDSGDLDGAQAAAEQAISFCRRSSRGYYEAIAHGVLARVLLRRDGATGSGAAEAALAEASALIERSNAKALVPRLCEWRAELAGLLGDKTLRSQLLQEAEAGYQKIGAPLLAEQVARELAS